MKLYNVGIGSLILRFEIFAAFIVIAGFAGFLYVGLVVGMILFICSIVGLQFKLVSKDKTAPVPFKHEHIPLFRYNLWHQRHHWTTH